jgi:hypothetical protein
MAAFVEPDRVDEQDSAQGDASRSPAIATQRCCKVLEYGVGPAVALLYVFYSLDPARRFQVPARFVLRIPGKGWRHAVDFRAGDLLRLPGGRIAAVEKLIAAPSLDDVCGLAVERVQTYVAGRNGAWARSGAAQLEQLVS